MKKISCVLAALATIAIAAPAVAQGKAMDKPTMHHRTHHQMHMHHHMMKNMHMHHHHMPMHHHMMKKPMMDKKM
jgi:hypothetical protein